MKTETSISFLARTARRLADATVARTATQARTAAERLGVTLILALLTTATAWAQTSQPHAIYCDANKTLYFAYGVKDEMFTETPDPDDETNTILKFTPEGSSEEVTVTEWYTGGSVISSDKPAWSSDLMGSVSSVVFESSFASVRPTSFDSWFRFRSADFHTRTGKPEHQRGDNDGLYVPKLRQPDIARPQILRHE